MATSKGNSSTVDPRLVDKYLRVVLPKAIAETLKVGPGDHIAFMEKDGRVEVRKVRMSLE